MFRDYFKSLTPPFSRKDALPVILTLVVLLLISISIFTLNNQNLKKSLAATSQDLGPQTVKVLVMSYYPLDSTGTNLNVSETNYGSSLDSVRQKVNGLTNQITFSLTEGSKYHGFKNSSAQASAIVQVADSKEYLKAIPKSTFQAWSNPTVRPDYRKMLTEDVNICNYVDNLGVKQVWIWGYHNPNPGGIEPDESNMSMGLSSKGFWNFSTYGDVSNSQRIDDLPVCNSTYVLYNYSYSVGLGNALEDHGHQIESELNFIDFSFWDSKFRNPHGLTDGTVNHCGWMHSPPNVTDSQQYNWYSETSVPSDCADWKPDGTGQVVATSCHTWYGATCTDDGGSKYKIWWFQNNPGLNNQLTYQGKGLRNWWDFFTNFDAAIAAGKTLFLTTTASPTPTVVPSPTLATTPMPPLTPVPGVNLALSKGTTSNRTELAGHDTGKAVDGDISTPNQSWQVPNPINPGDWFQVDLGSNQPVSKVVIYPNVVNSVDMCNSFSIATSPTGAFTGEQTTVVTEPSRPNVPINTYTFPAATGRFVRMTCSLTQNWVQLQEFQVFSGTASISATPAPTTIKTPTPTVAIPSPTVAVPSPTVVAADTTAPSIPTGLSATVNSATKVTLNWTASTDNVGVTGYFVIRNGVTIGSTTSNTFSDISVSPSTSYTYQVQARDLAGNFSSLSAQAQATTPALPDTTAPSAPTNLTSQVVSTSQVNLTWGASTDNVGVVGYDIYRNNVKIATITSTSFGDGSLNSGTSYTYYVVARDAAGNQSSQSNTVVATTQKPTPVPTSIPVTTGNISGTVISSTGGGVAGAKVVLNVNGGKMSITTTSQGTYYASGIRAGSYDEQVSAPHYTTEKTTATIIGGQTTVKNVTLNFK